MGSYGSSGRRVVNNGNQSKRSRRNCTYLWVLYWNIHGSHLYNRVYGSPHMSYRGLTRYTSQETGPCIDYTGSGCTHLADHQGAYLLLIRKFTPPPFPYTLPLSTGASGASHTTLPVSLPYGTLSAPVVPSSITAFPLISPASVGPSFSLPISHCTTSSGLTPIPSFAEIPPTTLGGPLPPSLIATPFKLANCLAPIPEKLVARIQALQFVEMRELLPDNVALAERLAALLQGLGPHKQPEQQEVGSLTTWAASFATYIAIVAQICPNRVWDMLAYMRIIIREARKFGGHGWLTYDAVFRRKHEGPSAQWDFIDPSLHVAYIAGHDHPPILPCHHCNETDHESNICAIVPLIPRTRGFPAQMQKSRPPIPKGRRPTPYPSRLGPKRVCHSWNRGKCIYPGSCNFTHICEGSHPAKDCPRLPQDSPYRSMPRRNPGFA